MQTLTPEEQERLQQAITDATLEIQALTEAYARLYQECEQLKATLEVLRSIPKCSHPCGLEDEE